MPMDLEELRRDWLGGGKHQSEHCPAPGPPRYRDLADRLRHAVEAGDLSTGERLPSERDLARLLCVSRTTVAGAYRLLRREGLLEGHRGGGTRVAVRTGLGLAMPSFALSSQKLTGEPAVDTIDLATSAIAGSSVLPRAQLSTADLLELSTLHSHPFGLPDLRAELAARHTAHMLPVTAEEILVTAGAQQAISLICRLFAGPGSVVIVETPTYVGALDAIRATGAAALGLPTDEQGLIPQHLRTSLERQPASLIYLMSTCHNPTGRTTSPMRRRHISRIAEDFAVPIVDDAATAELAAPSDLLAPMAGGALRIGSFSKVFWPGLRVGWICGPTEIISRLARLKVTSDIGTSYPSQLLATRLLAEADQTAVARRLQLAHRRAVLLDNLRSLTPEWIIPEPSAGMFLWARLPDADTVTFSRIALAHGVRVLPGTRATADGTFTDHLRISYGGPEADLSPGAKRLALAWAAYKVSDRPPT